MGAKKKHKNYSSMMIHTVALGDRHLVSSGNIDRQPRRSCFHRKRWPRPLDLNPSNHPGGVQVFFVAHVSNGHVEKVLYFLCGS